MTINKPTHVSKKTGKRVVVERHEDDKGGILVVKTPGGEFVNSYEAIDRAKFNKRYKSLAVKG